jgi:uroporphyrinogen III methyltransferase/synthase
MIPRHADIERMRRLVRAGAIDLVTFTSSSTVTNFQSMLGAQITGLKAAVIGPVTAETARINGFDVVVSPPQYTMEGLLEAVLSYFNHSEQR